MIFITLFFYLIANYRVQFQKLNITYTFRKITLLVGKLSHFFKIGTIFRNIRGWKNQFNHRLIKTKPVDYKNQSQLFRDLKTCFQIAIELSQQQQLSFAHYFDSKCKSLLFLWKKKKTDGSHYIIFCDSH